MGMAVMSSLYRRVVADASVDQLNDQITLGRCSQAAVNLATFL